MNIILSLASILVLLVSCAHTGGVNERTPAQTDEVRQVALQVKPEDLTVWSLQTLAQSGRIDILNDLFNNHGINLEKLPEGYAAGAGARVLGADNSQVSKLLDNLTGANWRGKVFFPSENPRKSMGLNRIKQTLVLNTSIVPMASFVTLLLDKHPLVPEAKSNLVILNYAKPVTKNYWQELTLTQIQVYDVMVAVPGKYGPIFIGKTWQGEYHEDRSFEAKDKSQLMAWFFLDFNTQALNVQKTEHWDGSKEKLVKPIPFMRNSKLPNMPE